MHISTLIKCLIFLTSTNYAFNRSNIDTTYATHNCTTAVNAATRAPMSSKDTCILLPPRVTSNDESEIIVNS